MILFLVESVKLRFQIENGVFILLAGSDSNLFKINDWSNLCTSVFILDGDNIFIFFAFRIAK